MANNIQVVGDASTITVTVIVEARGGDNPADPKMAKRALRVAARALARELGTQLVDELNEEAARRLYYETAW